MRLSSSVLGRTVNALFLVTQNSEVMISSGVEFLLESAGLLIHQQWIFGRVRCRYKLCSQTERSSPSPPFCPTTLLILLHNKSNNNESVK